MILVGCILKAFCTYFFWYLNSRGQVLESSFRLSQALLKLAHLQHKMGFLKSDVRPIRSFYNDYKCKVSFSFLNSSENMFLRVK